MILILSSVVKIFRVLARVKKPLSARKWSPTYIDRAFSIFEIFTQMILKLRKYLKYSRADFPTAKQVKTRMSMIRKHR